MGGSESKENGFPVEDFTFIGVISDAFYGDVKLLSHKLSGRVFLTLTFSFNNKDDLQKALASSEKRRSLKSKGLIQQPYFYSEAKTNLCSNLFLLRKVIEYAPMPLSIEILKRREENKKFNESEIWHVMKSCLQGLEALKSIHIFHGDLRPSNVMITQTKQVKIIERGYFIHELPSYAMMLSGDFKDCYPSPLILKSLKTKEKKPIHQPFKSDVYSLGVMVIEMCTGLPTQDIYNFSTLEIENSVLEEKLDEIERSFSTKLIELLREILKKDELERASVEFILSEIEEAEKRSYIKVAENLMLSAYGRNFVEKALAGSPIKFGSPNSKNSQFNNSDFSNKTNSKNNYFDSPASFYKNPENEYKDLSNSSNQKDLNSSPGEQFPIPGRTFSEFHPESYNRASKRNDPFRRSLNENNQLYPLKEEENYKIGEGKRKDFLLNEFDVNVNHTDKYSSSHIKYDGNNQFPKTEDSRSRGISHQTNN